MDEFVIGFISDEPEGYTQIDIVMELTGLTYEEVKSCMKTIDLDIFKQES